MIARRTHDGPLHRHQRGAAAVVLSRADPLAGPRASGKGRQPADAPNVAPRRSPRWPAVVTWVALGAAIAALWALLLLGDSLVVSG